MKIKWEERCFDVASIKAYNGSTSKGSTNYEKKFEGVESILKLFK